MHAAILCFVFYDLDGPVRDDEPEFHPPGHIHRVLSGMGAAVLSPFLLRPLAWAERQLRPAMTLIRHRRSRAWVHLAPWQPTTDLTPERVHQFWQSVMASTRQALEKHHIVIISSHLLTDMRAHRVLAYIAEGGLTVHHRTYRIPLHRR